jgi:hypothetical protein
VDAIAVDVHGLSNRQPVGIGSRIRGRGDLCHLGSTTTEQAIP